MKRTLRWIIIWLAAASLLLSAATAARRVHDSGAARIKGSAGSSRELLCCRILPAEGTSWIPSRAGPQRSSRMPAVFLVRVADDILATGLAWLNRRGPPGSPLCLPGLCGCWSGQQPKKAVPIPFSPRISASVDGEDQKSDFCNRL
jgi:hypothetical protein